MSSNYCCCLIRSLRSESRQNVYFQPGIITCPLNDDLYFFFQQCGFVVVVDWSGFSLRQGSALGAAALRNLIAALRGRFPARFKAIHFLSAPLYVQATLALVKPFLDEKTRNKVRHGADDSRHHKHE